VPVPPGARFEILSAGGGGWGDPAERDTKSRRADGREGLPPMRRRNGEG
jgi:N-methylhydantoinase B/oxoprolinase/acetone carboxylase alpha subunit